MARKKPQKAENKAEEKDEAQEPHQPRPFWSGIIVFGLVSLPVSLFPANRGKSLSLNMVDEEGNPLRRQYVCEKEDKALTRDDIVRGYPVDKDQFVVVEDEELEALAPEKTREIDLGRFVPLAEINPVFFERGYFLAPDSDTNKAYRLLARSMEEEQRAGIATFVMRDREYLIAIMAERGILRAETLRFHDEIRSPDQVGLPEKPAADKQVAKELRRAIKDLSKDKLDPDVLQEEQAARLQKLIARKLKSGKDVLESEQAPEEAAPESNVVDLMQVLKDRLKGKMNDKEPRETSKTSRQRGKKPKSGTDSSTMEDLSRDELYAQAQKQRIPGRSKMTKDQLRDALQQTG